MAGYYPPVGFHFKVEVLGLPPNDNDVRFTDVGGLVGGAGDRGGAPRAARTASSRSTRRGPSIRSWC